MRYLRDKWIKRNMSIALQKGNNIIHHHDGGRGGGGDGVNNNNNDKQQQQQQQQQQQESKIDDDGNKKISVKRDAIVLNDLNILAECNTISMNSGGVMIIPKYYFDLKKCQIYASLYNIIVYNNVGVADSNILNPVNILNPAKSMKYDFNSPDRNVRESPPMCERVFILHGADIFDTYDNNEIEINSSMNNRAEHRLNIDSCLKSNNGDKSLRNMLVSNKEQVISSYDKFFYDTVFSVGYDIDSLTGNNTKFNDSIVDLFNKITCPEVLDRYGSRNIDDYLFLLLADKSMAYNGAIFYLSEYAESLINDKKLKSAIQDKYSDEPCITMANHIEAMKITNSNFLKLTNTNGNTIGDYKKMKASWVNNKENDESASSTNNKKVEKKDYLYDTREDAATEGISLMKNYNYANDYECHDNDDRLKTKGYSYDRYKPIRDPVTKKLSFEQIYQNTKEKKSHHIEVNLPKYELHEDVPYAVFRPFICNEAKEIQEGEDLRSHDLYRNPLGFRGMDSESVFDDTASLIPKIRSTYFYDENSIVNIPLCIWYLLTIPSCRTPYRLVPSKNINDNEDNIIYSLMKDYKHLTNKQKELLAILMCIERINNIYMPNAGNSMVYKINPPAAVPEDNEINIIDGSSSAYREVHSAVSKLTNNMCSIPKIRQMYTINGSTTNEFNNVNPIQLEAGTYNLFDYQKMEGTYSIQSLIDTTLRNIGRNASCRSHRDIIGDKRDGTKREEEEEEEEDLYDDVDKIKERGSEDEDGIYNLAHFLNMVSNKDLDIHTSKRLTEYDFDEKTETWNSNNEYVSIEYEKQLIYEWNRNYISNIYALILDYPRSTPFLISTELIEKKKIEQVDQNKTVETKSYQVKPAMIPGIHDYGFYEYILAGVSGDPFDAKDVLINRPLGIISQVSLGIPKCKRVENSKNRMISEYENCPVIFPLEKYIDECKLTELKRKYIMEKEGSEDINNVEIQKIWPSESTYITKYTPKTSLYGYICPICGTDFYNPFQKKICAHIPLAMAIGKLNLTTMNYWSSSSILGITLLKSFMKAQSNVIYDAKTQMNPTDKNNSFNTSGVTHMFSVNMAQSKLMGYSNCYVVKSNSVDGMKKVQKKHEKLKMSKKNDDAKQLNDYEKKCIPKRMYDFTVDHDKNAGLFLNTKEKKQKMIDEINEKYTDEKEKKAAIKKLDDDELNAKFKNRMTAMKQGYSVMELITNARNQAGILFNDKISVTYPEIINLYDELNQNKALFIQHHTNKTRDQITPKMTKAYNNYQNTSYEYKKIMSSFDLRYDLMRCVGSNEYGPNASDAFDGDKRILLQDKLLRNIIIDDGLYCSILNKYNIDDDDIEAKPYILDNSSNIIIKIKPYPKKIKTKQKIEEEEKKDKDEIELNNNNNNTIIDGNDNDQEEKDKNEIELSHNDTIIDGDDNDQERKETRKRKILKTTTTTMSKSSVKMSKKSTIFNDKETIIQYVKLCASLITSYFLGDITRNINSNCINPEYIPLINNVCKKRNGKYEKDEKFISEINNIIKDIIFGNSDDNDNKSYLDNANLDTNSNALSIIDRVNTYPFDCIIKYMEKINDSVCDITNIDHTELAFHGHSLLNSDFYREDNHQKMLACYVDTKNNIDWIRRQGDQNLLYLMLLNYYKNKEVISKCKMKNFFDEINTHLKKGQLPYSYNTVPIYTRSHPQVTEDFQIDNLYHILPVNSYTAKDKKNTMRMDSSYMGGTAPLRLNVIIKTLMGSQKYNENNSDESSDNTIDIANSSFPHPISKKRKDALKERINCAITKEKMPYSLINNKSICTEYLQNLQQGKITIDNQKSLALLNPIDEIFENYVTAYHNISNIGSGWTKRAIKEMKKNAHEYILATLPCNKIAEESHKTIYSTLKLLSENTNLFISKLQKMTNNNVDSEIEKVNIFFKDIPKITTAHINNSAKLFGFSPSCNDAFKNRYTLLSSLFKNSRYIEGLYLIMTLDTLYGSICKNQESDCEITRTLVAGLSLITTLGASRLMTSTSLEKSNTYTPHHERLTPINLVLRPPSQNNNHRMISCTSQFPNQPYMCFMNAHVNIVTSSAHQTPRTKLFMKNHPYRSFHSKNTICSKTEKTIDHRAEEFRKNKSKIKTKDKTNDDDKNKKINNNNNNNNIEVITGAKFSNNSSSSSEINASTSTTTGNGFGTFYTSQVNALKPIILYSINGVYDDNILSAPSHRRRDTLKKAPILTIEPSNLINLILNKNRSIHDVLKCIRRNENFPELFCKINEICYETCLTTDECATNKKYVSKFISFLRNNDFYNDEELIMEMDDKINEEKENKEEEKVTEDGDDENKPNNNETLDLPYNIIELIESNFGCIILQNIIKLLLYGGFLYCIDQSSNVELQMSFVGKTIALCLLADTTYEIPKYMCDKLLKINSNVISDLFLNQYDDDDDEILKEEEEEEYIEQDDDNNNNNYDFVDNLFLTST